MFDLFPVRDDSHFSFMSRYKTFCPGIRLSVLCDVDLIFHTIACNIVSSYFTIYCIWVLIYAEYPPMVKWMHYVIELDQGLFMVVDLCTIP